MRSSADCERAVIDASDLLKVRCKPENLLNGDQYMNALEARSPTGHVNPDCNSMVSWRSAKTCIPQTGVVRITNWIDTEHVLYQSMPAF